MAKVYRYRGVAQRAEADRRPNRVQRVVPHPSRLSRHLARLEKALQCKMKNAQFSMFNEKAVRGAQCSMS
jgi:hypothetical protein